MLVRDKYWAKPVQVGEYLERKKFGPDNKTLLWPLTVVLGVSLEDQMVWVKHVDGLNIGQHELVQLRTGQLRRMKEK